MNGAAREKVPPSPLFRKCRRHRAPFPTRKSSREAAFSFFSPPEAHTRSRALPRPAAASTRVCGSRNRTRGDGCGAAGSSDRFVGMAILRADGIRADKRAVANGNCKCKCVVDAAHTPLSLSTPWHSLTTRTSAALRAGFYILQRPLELSRR